MHFKEAGRLLLQLHIQVSAFQPGKPLRSVMSDQSDKA